MPMRPLNADPGSVYVETVKTGYWQYCRFDAVRNVNRCKVVNERGDVLFDEEYRPYDGGAPVPQQDLVIVPGKYDKAITFRNGRLLLPNSQYDLIKHHIDWLMGKVPAY
jgi:hypothetical protein